MPLILFLIFLGCVNFQNPPQIQTDVERIPPDSLYAEAVSYLDEDNFEEAARSLSILLLDPVWAEDLSNKRKTYNNLGFSHHKLQNYDASVFFYEKANDAAKQLGDTTRIIASFNSLAMGYRNLGLYSLSLERSQSALTLAQIKKDGKMTAQIHNTMALMYFDLRDIPEALSHHQLSLSISISLKDSIMIAYGYNNIARCHQQLHNYDSSLFYNKKALGLKYNLSLDNKSIVNTLNNMGLDFLKLDSLVLAEKYLAESSAVYKALNDQRGLVISYNNLSDLSIRRKQFDAAEAYLDSGAVILAEINAKDLQADHLELQVALAEKTGRHAEALNFHKELSTLKEDIFQEEKLKVQQVESSYLLREKELERATAAQEAAFARAKNQWYLQLILILAASVLVTGSLLYFLLRLNKMLKVKNNIIQSQKEDLKHRTFNVLMRVQSLIRMASESLTDETSKRVLANSEAAILSAASLQQHLSYDGGAGHIMIGSYLEDLVSRLEEVFHLTGHPISYKVDIQEESILPVNTVMNLGIIVAELVTNASKHAFNEQIAQPEIVVRLEKKGTNLIVSVVDNGIGLPQVEKQGVGTGLIKKLAGYIKAEMSVRSEGGTSYTFKLHT